MLTRFSHAARQALNLLVTQRRRRIAQQHQQGGSDRMTVVGEVRGAPRQYVAMHGPLQRLIACTSETCIDKHSAVQRHKTSSPHHCIPEGSLAIYNIYNSSSAPPWQRQVIRFFSTASYLFSASHSGNSACTASNPNCYIEEGATCN